MDPWIDKKLDVFFDKSSADFHNMDVFKEIFAKLDEYEHTKPEVFQYELWRIRDLKNSFETAFEEGRMKTVKRIAANLLKLGKPIEDIIKYTHLTKEDILQLQ